MSVDFRQRTPGELARMVWRGKWLILLPTAAVAVAVAYVVWRLPNVYESTTLLTVRPASIVTGTVAQLSDSDLTLRINNITQEVTSRSEEHTSELQSRQYLVCRLLLEKKKYITIRASYP